MEVADAETEPGRRLKPPAGRVHADGRRRERVVGREDQGAPVLSAMVGRVGWARDDVVPSKFFFVSYEGFHFDIPCTM